MRVVYLAAPLSGPTHEAIQGNRARAARWCAWAVRQGVCPVAMWIVLTGELPETPENRALGLELDCEVVRRCDELWLVGGRVSSGMQEEALEARRHGIPVLDLTELGEEPPSEDELDAWLEANT